ATDPAHAAFVMGGNNGLRTPQNGVVGFDFAGLNAFNGLTTGAGYVFSNVVAADTEIYRISFAVVPEPASAGLSLLGGIALMGLRRFGRLG
ncbi:MAG: PEP-CTERM sorting domain-containing protein, partial [Planctomycetota bacterium]|nr:PEP-CTERM sorting domain-containing protein [Planctomycetota bacterium]